MLIKEREELRSKGLPPIEHRVLAELAGYVCQEKYRAFNPDQTPVEDSKYVTVTNIKAPIPKETDVAAPSANEAWQTFLTMIWRPDNHAGQCREVLIGAMLEDKEELGRQIQAEVFNQDAPTESEYDNAEDNSLTCVEPDQSFAYEQVADVALMTSKATLRAVRSCDFFRTMTTELTELLRKNKAPKKSTVDDQIPSEPETLDGATA